MSGRSSPKQRETGDDENAVRPNRDAGTPFPNSSFPMLLPLGVLLIVGLLAIHFAVTQAPPPVGATVRRSVPTFSLNPVTGLQKPGLSSADLRKGRVTLVNVFASWCATCRQEHPALLSLSRSGLEIIGIALQDPPEKTRQFLEQEGNPYRAVGVDQSGQTALDFGVTGVPETFVIDGNGMITQRIAGRLTDDNIDRDLMPAIARANR